MRFARIRTAKNRGRAGYAVILLLLVSVAILMVLYFIDLRMLFGPVGPMDKTAAERPWLEEKRIVGEGAVIKLPKPPKPEIINAFVVEAAVIREGVERGYVTIDFTPDGKVAGSWNCGYLHSEQKHVFDSIFEGNIDVSKTFADDNGKDRSKLYFITKGDYTEEIYNSKTGATSVTSGIIYTTGWLYGGRSVHGIITITTDKTWSLTYSFTTEAGDIDGTKNTTAAN